MRTKVPYITTSKAEMIHNDPSLFTKDFMKVCSIIQSATPITLRGAVALSRNFLRTHTPHPDCAVILQGLIDSKCSEYIDLVGDSRDTIDYSLMA